MAGYASDQFYNFGKSYEAGKSIARTSQDNPNFLWPRPIQPDVYNPISGTQLVNTKMQRGFIRGIYPTVLAGNANPSASQVKQRRLFFQFNPETIDRTVQMNAMVANPLTQDPSQIFQPVAGTAAFSFELLFNREAEVVSAMTAKEQIRNGGYVATTASPLTSSLDIYGGIVNGKGVDYRQSDVASLGVLADMYVLDSIIGQSITPDLAGFIRDYFSTASNAQQAYASRTGGASVAAFDTTGFDTNVTKNFGNGAFLSPLPIRIVFSSLFMVEGFVETSSVAFVKFTKNYVPTICKVSLNIRALYIGFAKEEAYLTSALKVAVKDMQATQRQDDLLIARASRMAEQDVRFTYTTPDMLKSYADDGKLWVYGVRPDGYATPQEFWNDGIWPPGDSKPSGGASIIFQTYQNAGQVRSWVSPELSKAIKDGQISSLTISTSMTLEEVNPTTKEVIKKLIESPIKYVKHSATSTTSLLDHNAVTNEQMAENIVKATEESKARKNRYYVQLGDQSTSMVMENANSLLRMTITNTITMKVNTNNGVSDVSTIVSDYIDIGGPTFSNKLTDAGDGKYTLRVPKRYTYGIRVGGPTS